MCALKGVANQQTGADSLVDTIFEGLQDQNRLKIANERRRFVEVDSNEAKKIGDLEKNSDKINVITFQFDQESFSNAVTREGTDGWKLREGE